MHAPKSAKDQYKKFRRLTEGVFKEGVKIILKLPYLIWKWEFEQKIKKHVWLRDLQSVLSFLTLGTLVGRKRPKTSQRKTDQIFTADGFKDEPKLISKLPYPIWLKLEF